MIDISIIREKFVDSVFKDLDKDNFYKIIFFLKEKKCDFIEDVVEDYLDLFIFDYNEFVKKFNILNKKYDGKFLKELSKNMNLFEEFYNV